MNTGFPVGSRSSGKVGRGPSSQVCAGPSKKNAWQVAEEDLHLSPQLRAVLERCK